MDRSRVHGMVEDTPLAREHSRGNKHSASMRGASSSLTCRHLRQAVSAAGICLGPISGSHQGQRSSRLLSASDGTEALGINCRQHRC